MTNHYTNQLFVSPLSQASSANPSVTSLQEQQQWPERQWLERQRAEKNRRIKEMLDDTNNAMPETPYAYVAQPKPSKTLLLLSTK